MNPLLYIGLVWDADHIIPGKPGLSIKVSWSLSVAECVLTQKFSHAVSSLNLFHCPFYTQRLSVAGSLTYVKRARVI